MPGQVPTPPTGSACSALSRPGSRPPCSLASYREDGVLGQGVARFAEDADERLARIAADLRSGTYEPGQLTPVGLPRPDGQMRMLHIPTVRDRVVERSILAVLEPDIDPLLGPFSYAYRPGL